MSKTTLLKNPDTVAKVAALFASRYEQDPSLPNCRAVVVEIMADIAPAYEFPIGPVPPPIIQAIDAVCLERFQTLPPKLGAGARRMLRNPDGSDAGTGPKYQAGVAVELNGANGENGHRERNGHKKIRWIHEEIELIAEQAIEQWKEKPEHGIDVDLLNKAVGKIMEPARQRHLASVHTSETLYQVTCQKARDVLKKAFEPPPPPPAPKVEIRTERVLIPYDVDKVLAEAPLPRIAAVFHERMTILQLRAFNATTLPTPTTSEKLVAAGTDPANVEAMLPRIQVIGLRGHEDKRLREEMGNRPCIILSSVDPSEMVHAERIFNDLTLCLVNTENVKNDSGWRKIAVDKYKDDKRSNEFGISRVIDSAKGHVSQWQAKHPDVVALWKEKHAPR